ncbi:MAG: type III pantothenate kinase [Chloroflexi bacterium]|nr:type III pantothenate kinase [Chloroflexota bacterium]
MLLAIDVGNTNVVMGVFRGEKLEGTWRIATDVHKMADEYGVLLLNLLSHEMPGQVTIDDAILCSVVPPLVTTFEDLCQRYFGISPMVVDAGIKTGIRISMDNPREVGADRIVNAVAAHHLYGCPIIVIDFGTATTLDAVSQGGEYLGGAIAPGIGIAADALFQRASKLPRIELVLPKKAIGRNTVTAMQSGLLFGYIGLIESLVNRMRQEMGVKAKVVATGGLSRLFARATSVIDEVNLDLTLIGLHLIYDMNRASHRTAAEQS